MANRTNSTSPEAPDGKPPMLNVDSHRGLLAARQEIVDRLHANPDVARLLLVNPLSAFQDVGVKLSPEMASHVLHTLQNSGDTAVRRQSLEATLREVAGEKPKPSDPAWVATFLFKKLKLKPLDTAKATPVYKSAFDPEIEKRQLASIPKLNTSPALPHPDHGTAFVFDSVTPSVRHLDLENPAPKLPHVDEPPASVDLTTLYFYKDADPRARDLLELGLIESQSFQVSSTDTYRKIKSGKAPNPWGNWVTDITFSAPTK